MKKCLLTVIILIGAICTFGQIFPQENSADAFTFSSGIKEWSDTKTIEVEGVPLEVRIRLYAKVMLRCIYEVEVKNLSDKKVSFQASTGWKNLMGKHQSVQKFNLKPGATSKKSLSWQSLKNPPKDSEGCLACSWALNFLKFKAK